MMWLLFRVVLFLLCLFSFSFVVTSSAVIAGKWGDAYATVAYAMLTAAFGFGAEYALSGRCGWYLAAVFPITMFLRVALWTLVDLVFNIGAIAVVPGFTPNRFADIAVTAGAFALAAHVVCWQRRIRHQRSNPTKSSGEVDPEGSPEEGSRSSQSAGGDR